MLVGELESQYKKLTGLIQGHIAQIVFTELVCDYYQFNWSIDRLKKEVKNKLNLKKLDKVYAEQLYSILSMEEDLRKKAQSNNLVDSNGSFTFKSTFSDILKPLRDHIYNSMTPKEREEYEKIGHLTQLMARKMKQGIIIMMQETNPLQKTPSSSTWERRALN